METPRVATASDAEMGKNFRPCDLDQMYLLPPSLQDWLPENHLARFIADVSGHLDLQPIYAVYEEREGRGQAAYDPRMMVRLLLYGYCIGRRSSRQIEKATYDDVAFRYLAADQHPDHDTIAAFRQEHLASLAGLFAQVLRMCREAGLVKLGQMAIDSTKIRAHADRHRTMRYQQLEEAERALDERVRALLQEAAQVDAEEDARYGKEQKPQDLPAELATSQQRLQKIREAKQKLEQQAAERAAAARQERENQGGKHHNNASRKRFEAATRPVRQANPQYNFTDADSKIMLDSSSDSFVQGYNAQIVVDEAQVIVAAEVVSQTNDRGQLAPMVKAAQQELGARLPVVVADAGYFSVEGLEDEVLREMEVLVSPEARHSQRESHAEASCGVAAQMRERLATERGRNLYAKRAGMVEPVFGYIKAIRGLRQFLLRGLERVRHEWRLICLTHNLLKLRRWRQSLA